MYICKRKIKQTVMRTVEQILANPIVRVGEFIPSKNDFISTLDVYFRVKIDKSNIFKTAHRLFKKGLETFSEALKEAWRIEKTRVEENILKLAK